MKTKPAIFFDRDGVLNTDYGYVYRKEDFEWMQGAKQTIKWLNDKGYLVFVITNQSGIARGYYTEADMHALHELMIRDLNASNAHVDAFYHCPHYKDGIIEKYSIDCSCRKPQPGLLKQALHEWSIDISRSLMIGDKESDIQAAKAIGIPGYIFKGGNLYDFVINLRELR